MKRHSSILVLLCAFAFGSASALPPVPPLNPSPLAPLLWARSDVDTDNFYTIRESERDYIVTYGGYYANGTAAFVEGAHGVNLAPFRRFYSPTVTDHFYTHDVNEASYVLANGWTEDPTYSPEGHVYTSQVPGSVPLYRVNRVWPSSDHMHEYVTSWAAVQDRVSQGWGYDGVAGYVYKSATMPVPLGFAQGMRCPGLVTSCTNHRSNHFGEWYRHTTSRPTGTTVQWLQFDFQSWDFTFSHADHLGVMLRACLDRSGDVWNTGGGCHGYYYSGVGLAFGHLNCGSGSPRFGVEDFSGAGLINSSCANVSMSPGTPYTIYVAVGDNGLVSWNIRIKASGMIVGSGSLNIASEPGNHFDASNTGLFITGATMATQNYTTYVTNIQHGWL